MTSETRSKLLGYLLAFVFGVAATQVAIDYGPSVAKLLARDGEPSASAAPIPNAGFRFLVVYDSVNLAKLPAAQIDILTSPEIENYARAHCAKGADGKTPERRFFPSDADVSKEPAVWQNALKLPRQSLPWIVISDGKTGFSGPLPANVPDTLNLLKRYGGP
jgi:hypothetical protein